MNKTYIELRKKVEEILPDSIDFDYRSISLHDLLEKIKKLFEELEVPYTFYYDKEYERQLIDALHNIYINFSKIDDNRENQNNLYVKENVLYARNTLMAGVLVYTNNTAKSVNIGAGYGYPDADICTKNDGDPYYDESYGTLEEIEDLINKDNIKKYLSKVFTVSSNPNPEFYRIHLVSEILNDIGNHFGIYEYGWNHDREVSIYGFIIDEVKKNLKENTDRTKEFNLKASSIEKIASAIEYITHEKLSPMQQKSNPSTYK